MLAHLRLLFLILWLGLLAGTPVRAATSVVIVSSERSAAYLAASEAMLGELERTGVPRDNVVQLTSAEFAAAAPLAPRLFVALGAEAARVLARADVRVPVLCALLPRASFEQALLAGGRKVSSQFAALYLDQPWGRQLELIRLALPGARRIGVLWGPESQAQAAALRAQSQARGLELVEASIAPGELLFPSLKNVLDNADVLLAVADPQIYNSASIQNILLASFRARIPLVAFSPAYVRAGALFALHVTPAQVGVQAAELARALLQGKALPPTPIYAQNYSVAVNEHVARSLGLVLDEQVLRAQLRRWEGLP